MKPQASLNRSRIFSQFLQNKDDTKLTLTNKVQTAQLMAPPSQHDDGTLSPHSKCPSRCSLTLGKCIHNRHCLQGVSILCRQQVKHVATEIIAVV